MKTKEETWELLISLGAVEGKMPSGQWYLRGANLSEANLRGANLREACLIGACLSDAILIGTNLVVAYLCEADLSGATLSQANLAKANLSGATLSQANLSGAILSQANLCEANLNQANLRRAYLLGTDLSESNLSGANLSDANLLSANFYKASLQNCDLQDSLISNVNFNLSDLSGADLTGADFWGVSTTGWNIQDIKVRHIFFAKGLYSEEEKEKHIKYFKEGQFEELYKFLPTIELVLDGGISPADLLTLTAIVENINNQHTELGLKMTGMSVKGDQTLIEIQTLKDEFLDKTALLIKEGIDNAIKGLLTEKILLPYLNPPNSPYEIAPRHTNITLKVDKFEIHINKTDGSTYHINEPKGCQIGEFSNSVFYNYKSNENEINKLFESFKNNLSDLTASVRDDLISSTDRIIETLKEGKDQSKAQEYFDQISRGIATGGAASSILQTIWTLLGM